MGNCSHNIVNIQCNDNDFKKQLTREDSSYFDNQLKCINIDYCQPSNLIPHFWFYKIIDKNGDPDLPCIYLLSEVFGWFRNLSKSNTYYSTNNSLPELIGGKLAISYDFLAEKLNFRKERIRKNFVKLEALGILTREVKNIALEDGSRINQLYLSINQDFFSSCFRNPELDIRVRENESNLSIFERSHLLEGEHISKKKKNRSTESNFSKEDSNKIYKEENHNSKHQKTPNENTIVQKQITPKKLEDFYPLTKEDCSTLQSKSGREFSLHAMNEILKDMSKRLTDRFFYSKKGFISYMSKCFQYEMRDAVKVSNETFKIKANSNKTEQESVVQEKYLSEIENSLQVSPEWHLKKKLTSVLERSKAYNLLTSFKRLEICQEGKCSLILTKHIELTEIDKKIILGQIQATHERVGESGNQISINSVEILTPKKQYLDQLPSSLKPEKSKRDEGVWLKVRKLFSSSYGKDGEALDNHWISRLDAEVDKRKNKISLKASSQCVKSYIEERLWSVLLKVAKECGFELSGIECIS